MWFEGNILLLKTWIKMIILWKHFDEIGSHWYVSVEYVNILCEKKSHLYTNCLPPSFFCLYSDKIHVEADFDHFVLAVQWPVTYCATVKVCENRLLVLQDMPHYKQYICVKLQKILTLQYFSYNINVCLNLLSNHSS